MRTVVIHSGGLDSTTLLYHLRSDGNEVKALSVHYGQRHRKELDAARAICAQAGIEQRIVELAALAPLFGANRLTDAESALPAGPYSAESIALTTVPNRNMILIAIALGWAISLRFDAVAFGAHRGLHANYADCRPEFAAAIDQAAQRCDERPLQVLAPFVSMDKAAIVALGRRLGVPFELTWSCYQGGAKHCGRCGTCLDRREAFRRNGLTDPVEYDAT
jgi:7-cyano-7-deazaguanine synthase